MNYFDPLPKFKGIKFFPHFSYMYILWRLSTAFIRIVSMWKKVKKPRMMFVLTFFSMLSVFWSIPVLIFISIDNNNLTGLIIHLVYICRSSILLYIRRLLSKTDLSPKIECPNDFMLWNINCVSAIWRAFFLIIALQFPISNNLT